MEANSTMTDFAGKLPPQSVEAEKFLLGALLQDDTFIAEVLNNIKDDDFYYEKHGAIFKAIADLYRENIPIDVVTVEEKLLSLGKMAVVGERGYLFELMDSVATSANAVTHSEIIQNKSILRYLIKTSNLLIKECLDPLNDAQKVLDTAEKEFFKIAQSNVKGGLRRIDSLLVETMNIINSYKGESISGVPTGFHDLDNLTSGLQPTDLIVLAGRPGMGKTAFALSLMANSAIKYGKSVAFFSLEMGCEQLVQRILCSQAGINMQQLRQGKLPKSDYPKISLAAGPISDAPIYIDDQPGLNLVQLKSKCRMLSQQQGLDMIIIDYLQLMTGHKGAENRQQEISTISRGLKELAKELHVPILALSQLSRKVEERGGDGKPMLSDLRESGAIEQDADMVWFVYRPAKYQPDAEETYAELVVAKHRNGPLENVKMTFIGEHAGFYNYSGQMNDFDYEDV